MDKSPVQDVKQETNKEKNEEVMNPPGIEESTQKVEESIAKEEEEKPFDEEKEEIPNEQGMFIFLINIFRSEW